MLRAVRVKFELLVCATLIAMGIFSLLFVIWLLLRELCNG